MLFSFAGCMHLPVSVVVTVGCVFLLSGWYFVVILGHIGFVFNFRFVAVSFAKKLWLLIGDFMGFDR
jgi:hypothetical protein